MKTLQLGDVILRYSIKAVAKHANKRVNVNEKLVIFVAIQFIQIFLVYEIFCIEIYAKF